MSSSSASSSAGRRPRPPSTSSPIPPQDPFLVSTSPSASPSPPPPRPGSSSSLGRSGGPGAQPKAPRSALSTRPSFQHDDPAPPPPPEKDEVPLNAKHTKRASASGTADHPALASGARKQSRQPSASASPATSTPHPALATGAQKRMSKQPSRLYKDTVLPSPPPQPQPAVEPNPDQVLAAIEALADRRMRERMGSGGQKRASVVKVGSSGSLVRGAGGGGAREAEYGEEMENVGKTFEANRLVDGKAWESVLGDGSVTRGRGLNAFYSNPVSAGITPSASSHDLHHHHPSPTTPQDKMVRHESSREPLMPSTANLPYTPLDESGQADGDRPPTSSRRRRASSQQGVEMAALGGSSQTLKSTTSSSDGVRRQLQQVQQRATLTPAEAKRRQLEEDEALARRIAREQLAVAHNAPEGLDRKLAAEAAATGPAAARMMPPVLVDPESRQTLAGVAPSRPWFLGIMTVIQVATVCISLIINWQWTGSVIQTNPFNVMLGPSPGILIQMGARYLPCIKNTTLNTGKVPRIVCPAGIGSNASALDPTTNRLVPACTLEQICGLGGFQGDVPNQWYRFILPMFLHGGIVHLVVNLVFQIQTGFQLERDFGWWRTAAIYLLSGLGGFVFGGNFNGLTPSVGCSGALFGLMACLVIDLFQNWKVIHRPWWELAKLTFTILLSFLIGMLPYIDNFAHIGGFFCGILTGLIFMPTVHYSKWDGRVKIGLLLLAIPVTLVV
ncbi:hypothetical protein HDU96_006743, partial [Phlyctochytrium bullatum]